MGLLCVNKGGGLPSIPPFISVTYALTPCDLQSRRLGRVFTDLVFRSCYAVSCFAYVQVADLSVFF